MGITVLFSLCTEKSETPQKSVIQTPKETPPPAVMTPLPPEHYIKLFVRYFNERNATKLYDLLSDEVKCNHSIEELESALRLAEENNVTIVKWKILSGGFSPGNVTVDMTISENGKIVEKNYNRSDDIQTLPKRFRDALRRIHKSLDNRRY